MKIVAFDPYISEAAARELSVTLMPLEKLLAESDFISLHTAVSPQTQNMINAATIAQMKKGVRIVNAARGELINEADLAAALKSGHVTGAALDVFVEEPPKNSPLIGLPNVICTPHVAGSTAEAQEELGIQVAVQVRDYLAEGVIRNAVNLPALSPEQYRRIRPYLALAERLGSLVSQAAATRPARIRIRYAGELSEIGTHLLRSAVLAGLLNAVLDEKVNVVNAPAVAGARGLIVEEETRRREHGFPHTLEVAAVPEKEGAAGFSAEGTVLHDGSPRVINIDGIAAGSPIGRHGAVPAEPRRTRGDRVYRYDAGEAWREHRHLCAGTSRSHAGGRGRLPGAAGRRGIRINSGADPGAIRYHAGAAAALRQGLNGLPHEQESPRAESRRGKFFVPWRSTPLRSNYLQIRS